ncbi:hypothetical protein ASE26_05200 [Duganella sp. Root198D2]|nr:hypothetical protein ASD07_01370 [Duganella sp. Root336D2]KRB92379.1 hypothetical protein ASE26_05200 [Duganella sp. Root198D2]
MLVHNQPPEIFGGLQFQRVAIGVSTVCQAHCLRDVRIGVYAAQPIFARGKRADKPCAIEPTGGGEMPGIVVDFEEFRQNVTHRTKFVLRIAAAVRAEQPVNLCGIKRCEPLPKVVCHPASYLERLLVPDIGMGVEEARHNLLDRVIRHQDALRIGPRLTFKLVKCSCGKSRQVTIQIQAALAFGELTHQVVHPVAKQRAAGSRRHARSGGQIVPRHVPAQKTTIPTVIAACDAFFLGKFGQGAIGIK